MNVRSKLWITLGAFLIVGLSGVISMWPGTLNNKLFFNTERMQLGEEINRPICNVVNTRGMRRVFVCDTSIGYYLGVDQHSSDSIGEFLNKGATRMKKKKGDSIVYFEHIFIPDTIKVSFKVDPDNTLTDGSWIGKTKETVLIK